MKITIENFQSIAKAALTFTSLSVILGPSNHGKSAVLRAIEGALFNMPGEFIVRKGANNAVVEIEDLRGNGSPRNVRWTKGKSTNKYRIGWTGRADMDEFARVGSTAPEPLQIHGYRDVWIGDVDKKKGDSIRPQVASQFEPLFLLTRTGSFVSDVLGLMSRHHIVATAQDRCASDLRASKQRLGVRTGDRGALDEKLAVLDVQPVLDAHSRQGVMTTVQRAQQHDVVLRHRDRQRLLQALPVAPPAVPAVDTGEALEHARDLAVLHDLRVQKQRQLPFWKALLGRPAPDAQVTSVDAVLNPARAVAGIKRRRLLATVVAPSEKALPFVHTAAVDELRMLVAGRRAAMDALYQTQQAQKASTAEVETATLLFEGALQSMGACPTCGRA